jgi:hypothetical protein
MEIDMAPLQPQFTDTFALAVARPLTRWERCKAFPLQWAAVLWMLWVLPIRR